MTAFTFDINTIRIFEVQGDFRSGSDFEEFKKVVETSIVLGNVVQFDLSNVDFMDSDSMRFIGELEAKGTIITWGAWNDRSRAAYRRYKDYCDVKDIFNKRVNVMKTLAESGD